jgi:hypothetical protein
MDSQQVVQPMNISPDVSAQPKVSIMTSLGQKAGKVVKQFGMGAVYALLVMLFIYLLVRIMSSFESEKTDASLLGAAAAYAMQARHTMCKGGGGCSRKCPHIHRDDPRVAIGECVDAIELMYKNVRQGVSEERAATEVSIARLSAADQETATKKVEPIQATCNNVLMNLSAILSKAKSLDAIYANSTTVSVDVVNAKNRSAALHAAASLNKNVFVAAAIHIESYLKNMRIAKLNELDQHRIPNYDILASECQSFTTQIASTYALVSPLISNDATSEYARAIVVLVNDSAPSDTIVSAMAMLMNTTQTTRETVDTMMAKFEMVDDISQKCTIKDTFSNDLPGKPNSEMVSAMISTGDYSSALIKTALEPEIVTNHKKFAKERSSFDSGGGVPAVRDDDNDVVPWVGIFGRPTYRRTDGSSADTGTIALKSIPSDVPESLMRAKVPRLSLS